MLVRPNYLLKLLITLGVACALAIAQTPRIGRIEFYGLKKVSEERARKALGFAEGDPLPKSKADVEERLAEVPGIVEARLEATCCDDGSVVLYIGIEERGATHFDVRTAPEDDVYLPEEVTATYHDFLAAVNEAVRRHATAEDLTAGHSLMADPDCRDIQLRFVTLAEKYGAQIRDVLHRSGDSEQRAIAAYVIGYEPNKAAALDDLQFAMRDADDTVRGNAIRALAAVGVYAKLNPDKEIKIPATWFIEMLNSLAWTDRNNAAVALVNLTESRDESTLQQLRARALPALIDMARWHYLAHALPAYILIGRVAGMPEKEIQDSWSNGERDQVIATVVKKFKLRD